MDSDGKITVLLSGFVHHSELSEKMFTFAFEVNLNEVSNKFNKYSNKYNNIS